MKQVVVTFNFDPETELVSDVKCCIDGVEKKKKTTRKAKDVVVDLNEAPTLTLETNKLIFNPSAAALMGISAGDRIVIKWEKTGAKMTPIIGTDLAFDEEGSGNKLTKSNSIPYRGKSNTVLAEFGSVFSLQKSPKEGLWDLVSDKITAKQLADVQEEATAVKPELIVESEEDESEIDFQFKLD